jgi:omega-6 fatty acid desaturase (delta-12 desaturase)
MVTNAAALILITALALSFGPLPFLLVYLPVVTLAASMGVWLFFVQHQFETTYWARQNEWEFNEAALRSSSFYDLPAPLRWVTANIGIHHVHHLSSRIPYYRLGQVMRDEPALKSIGRLTPAQSLSCIGLALWDETRQRLISFREMRRDQRFAAAA